MFDQLALYVNALPRIDIFCLYYSRLEIGRFKNWKIGNFSDYFDTKLEIFCSCQGALLN